MGCWRPCCSAFTLFHPLALLALLLCSAPGWTGWTGLGRLALATGLGFGIEDKDEDHMVYIDTGWIMF